MKLNQLRHLETQNLDLNENFSLIYLRVWKFGATYHIFFTATGTNPHLYPISNLPRNNWRNVRKSSPWLNFTAEAKPSGVFTLWSELCVTEGQIFWSDWYHRGWIFRRALAAARPSEEAGGFSLPRELLAAQHSWKPAPLLVCFTGKLLLTPLSPCLSWNKVANAHPLLAKSNYSL